MKKTFSLLMGIILAVSAFGGDLVPVSAPPAIGATAAGDSSSPKFSAHGHSVVFVSQARNLTTNRYTSAVLNVYRYDLLSGQTLLVSSADAGVAGDGNSVFASSSSNGQFIAFASVAANLVLNDTNSAFDIFVRDVSNRTTRAITSSLSASGTPSDPSYGSSQPLSSNPQVSADGHWVAFESRSVDLDARASTSNLNVFATDLVSNTTVLVSVGTDGTSPPPPARSHSPHLSADGRFVTFISTATNLVGETTPPEENLFMRDLQENATQWFSRDVSTYLDRGSNGYRIVEYAISADAQVIAYKVFHPESQIVWLFRYDAVTGSTLLLTTNSYYRSSPRITPDGRFIAYDSGTNVLVWDNVIQSNILASVDVTGSQPATGNSHTPDLSRDGRYVVFLSDAGDLTTTTPNGKFQVYWRDLLAGTTKLISRNTNGLASNSDHEFITPALNSDGLHVAFESRATDLVANDLNNASDVFLYNISDDSIAAVSVSNSSRPAATRAGTSGSRPNAISADGHVVAFSTDGDLLVRDVAAGTTQAAINRGTNLLLDAEISADGRYVTYTRRSSGYSSLDFHDDLVRYDLSSGASESFPRESGAVFGGPPAVYLTSSNGQFVVMQTGLSLDRHDGNSAADIYVHDFTLNTNILVSFGAGGSATGGISPFLSQDERKLFFLNWGTNGYRQIYLKTLNDSAEPRLVSHIPNGTDAINSHSKSVAISGNSEEAVFGVMTNSADRTSVALFKYQIASDSVSFICSVCQNGSLDNSGALLAYETVASDGRRSVYARDLETGQTNLLSGPSDLGFASDTPLDSWSPLISGDARFVLFLSRNTGSPTNVTRLYVRDRAMNQTLLLTPNPEGIGLITGDGAQLGLSRNGRTAIFRSFAGDLVTGDYNDKRDVFVVHLGSGDSDGDGMDDDWEVAYFGDLSRDGSGDFDGDGQSDLQEFRAGTDPTNKDCVLRAITVSRVGGGTTVFWNAVAGRSYRVEFKENFNEAAWSTVSGQVQVSGSTGWIDDAGASSASQRFYRVVAVR